MIMRRTQFSAASAAQSRLSKMRSCHGLDGQSRLPPASNLPGEVMSQIAPSLSEADEADLAAYFAAIEVKIGKIPAE